MTVYPDRSGANNPFHGKRHPKEIQDLITRKKFLTWLGKFELTESLYHQELLQGNFWCSGHRKFHPLAAFHETKLRSRNFAHCRIWIVNSHLHRQFGAPMNWYETTFQAQRGGCAICGTRENIVRGKSALFAADHDHLTNQLRGLLCHICNAMVGRIERHLASTLAYLRKHPSRYSQEILLGTLR